MTFDSYCVLRWSGPQDIKLYFRNVISANHAACAHISALGRLPDAPMLERTILFAGAAFLAALVLEVSIRRQVLPFVIFWRGWKLSVRQILRDPGNLLLVFGLIAIGSLAENYLAIHAPSRTTGLLVAAVIWQAGLAPALALCAARFHLSIVPDIFADADYERMKLPQWRQIAAMVALVGAAVWLLGYCVTILSNVLVLNSPAGLISVSAIGMALFAQVLLAPLALIRPAIACGAAQPVTNGLRLAMRKLPLLLFLIVILALPPLLLQFGLGLLQAFAGMGEAGHVFASAVIAVFGTFQFFAYEAVTLVVLRDAVRPIVDPHAISGLRP